MGHYVRDLWSTLRAIESDEVAASVLRTVERGSGRASGWAIAKAMDKDPQAALEALKKKDLVLVHLEATDEAGHRGDLREKMAAIEKFDKLIVGTVVKGLRRNKNSRILVIPDHTTLVASRAHARDAVPFILYGREIPPGKAKAYSEKEAAQTGFVVEEGHRLMETFIGTFSKTSP